MMELARVFKKVDDRSKRNQSEDDSQDHDSNIINNSNNRKDGMSYFRTYITLLKSMINTGILFCPRSFYLGGSIFSSFICILMSYLTFICMRWLSNAHAVYRGSYAELAEKSIGPIGLYSVDIAIVLTQAGPCMLNVGFIMNNTIKALEILNMSIDESFILIAALLILIPLIQLKTIKEQSWIYIIADIIIVSSVILIGIYSPISGGSLDNINYYEVDNTIYTIGVIVYTFEGIATLLPIKSEMKNPEKFNDCLAIMFVTITAIMIIISNSCVYAYGKGIKDAVISNLPDEYWTAIMLVSYSLAVIFGVPLVIHPVFQIIEKHSNMQGVKYNVFRILFISALIVTGFIAKKHLGLIVSVVGGMFCGLMSFIFPTLIHMNLMVTSNREKIMCYLFLVMGSLLGAATLASILINI